MPAAPKRGSRPPAAGSGFANHAPHAVIDLRVAAIARALTDGLGRAQITEVVAKAQRDEAGKRAQARLSQPSPIELAAIVPFVWGDEPVAKRTVEYYISKARKLIKQELRGDAVEPLYVDAAEIARLTTLYRNALQKEHYAQALHASHALAKRLNRRHGRLTHRRHRFCRLIVKGMSPADAYRLAMKYPHSKVDGDIAARASKLLNDPTVMLKIAELRQQAEKRAVVSYASHIEALGELRDLAADDKQYAAATSAEVARGRASGLYVEEIHFTANQASGPALPLDPSKLSDAELDLLEQLLTKAAVDTPVVPANGNGSNGKAKSPLALIAGLTEVVAPTNGGADAAVATG